MPSTILEAITAIGESPAMELLSHGSPPLIAPSFLRKRGGQGRDMIPLIMIASRDSYCAAYNWKVVDKGLPDRGSSALSRLRLSSGLAPARSAAGAGTSWPSSGPACCSLRSSTSTRTGTHWNHLNACAQIKRILYNKTFCTVVQVLLSKALPLRMFDCRIHTYRLTIIPTKHGMIESHLEQGEGGGAVTACQLSL